MLLETKFDVDQVSDNLAWRFVRRDGQGSPDKGKEAGSINLTVGEAFHVRVKAVSKNRIEGFEVINFCLVSRPYIYQCGPGVVTEYAPPSQFAADKPGEIRGACTNLPADEFVRGAVDATERYHAIEQDWTGHLTVGEFQGRWELSVILTVKILRQDGSCSVRVFSFDPETDVSSGVVPGLADTPEEVCLVPEVDPSSGVV